ncbi:class I lanthipeptide [Taibaiella koreensis]|uniref:class I lanthipeptide n=1 Tax=Taibaiella koreensis TaxID=1268548 RepID=UPI000E59BC33|nr:class I lanthipeptide [Taibaiella koreensis]
MKKKNLKLRRLSFRKEDILPLQQQEKLHGGCPPTSAGGSCITNKPTCDNMRCTVTCPNTFPPQCSVAIVCIG